MRTLDTVKRDLFRVIRNALLALFLIPVLSYLFILHVQSNWDGEFVANVRRQIEVDTTVEYQRKADLSAMFKAVPPSRACSNTDPALASYRADVCERYGHVWQFYVAHNLVAGILLLELALCVALAVLARMAFHGRDAQYRSLVLSWRLLAWSSALIVVVQCVLVVWLSYWLTAYFFHRYIIKLVLLVGIAAGAAAVMAVLQIFARIEQTSVVDGELVREADAPALWERIRALAAQLKTAPPHRIVAGIDANFFVTEGGLTIQGRVFRGRTLYVSLPLLRVLDQREADAVLAHELAHFKGGDTSSGAALGPKLAQFDNYCARMSGPSLTLVGFYPLVAYRTILEIALMRDSREREFKADRAAAQAVHALPLMRALVKVAAYSSYRDRIERELFDRDSRHQGSIGIATYVAQGLQPFARSEHFRGLMEEASVPHPFDSHPKLQERMNNVKCPIADDEFGAVLDTPVLQSWSSEILTGEAIEARLWAAYESQFAQAHEHTLAYRYRPDTDAERDVVEQFFPEKIFSLGQDKRLVIDYEGLDLPDGARLKWREVSNIKYEDGIGGDVLTLTLFEKGVIGNKSTKVKLPGVKPQRELLKQVLGMYWHRHKVAFGTDK